MRVYINTDLEGVAGVAMDSQIGGDSAEYQKARRLLTHEVNAAVEGALSGGATDVLVNDGHASGFNFIFEELHPGARYLMGTSRPVWLPGLTEETEASLGVGLHAMAGTQSAVRDHTMSSVSWHNLWVNGRPMGEIGLWAAIAGHYDVPCVLVTGCEKACEEAVALIPGIETVVTKQGVSRYAAIMEPAEKVREMIRAGAKAALAKVGAVEPLKVETPVEIRIEFNLSAYADQIRIIPGRERVDARTIVFRGPDMVTTAQML